MDRTIRRNLFDQMIRQFFKTVQTAKTVTDGALG